MNHLEKALQEGNIFTRFGKLAVYILIILIVFLAHLLFSAGAVAIVYYVVTGSLKGVFIDAHGVLVLQSKNTIFATLVTPFALSLLFLILLIWLSTKRTLSEVINGTSSIRWNRAISGFATWFVIMLIYTTVFYSLIPEDYTLRFNIERFIPLLLLSLLFIPLQTTFEEILFRGHLAQGVGMLTRSRWAVLLIPSLIFALMHISNPEITKYGMGIMLSIYFATALIWGVTAILDDGLELGMGMHAANNLFICLFTTQNGAVFETDSVFEMTANDPYISLLGLCITGAIVILIFYKKYNWSFSTMNKKIEKLQN